MPRRVPDLRFGPGTSGGFTPAGVAAFDNLRPAAVVRELIQNSLDAARSAGVSPAIVRFRLTRVSRVKVPGIKSYERAFAKAVETQEAMTGGPLTGQAQLTAGTIRDALDRDKMDVLSVLDNGIGLDEQRMNALLSDGVSVKDGAATGTYGNGHSTAIPASDLRYVLYGGLTEGGGRIGAGHAVLASHYETGERHQRSGDGFYIRDFRASRETLYDYATGHQLPALIAKALDLIEAETPHGTAVIIPAFNHFLEEEQGLWPMVSHAASANFFVAVEEGDLVVSVEDHRWGVDKRPWTLDRSNLADVLDSHRDKRRAAAFLNGRRAYEAHEVYRTAEPHRVETDAGAIEIRLRENPDGITRVDLCRNGMWITDRVPGVSQSFADQVPFHAILSLNARDGRDLHEFIRIAEGPLHDAITIKRLPAPQRKACRSALRAITEWIVRNTRAVKSDAYLSDDFLTLDFGDAGGSGRGKSGNAFWGLPVPIQRRPVRERHLSSTPGEPDPGVPPGGGKGAKGGSTPTSDRRRARPSLPALFQAASCPAGKNRRRIRIECEKSCVDAQLRLVVDEALDATCERPGQDAYTPAVLGNVVINAKPASDKNLVRWDGQVIGVRLGDLAEGASVEVETDYQLRGDFSDLLDPSLRVEVFRTEQSAETGPDASDGTGQEIEP
ncbi:MAG: hypothetical protein OXI15_20230 [Chromatiales bacterium]|nr:hypothetical protein [Chromatiales bacterium]